ncbi:hypothetical protein CUJ84_Chr000330 [Rhizobium leguminosarum]|uniref:Uncharacterized protein n=1 Tax=Rhizobium leguminosarum TaxID=384 RepID=A0A2K9YXN8_RHILE|nr:hypothetical protein CUJ84_Chr000330 [Rhizobium leguminosarum]
MVIHAADVRHRNPPLSLISFRCIQLMTDGKVPNPGAAFAIAASGGNHHLQDIRKRI